jgi:N-acetylglucosaminyldiphosphoundecaprenol N-acetyl-beta-D-mannosaminyltransferase
MKDLGKRNVLGVLVDALDYEAATAKIIAAAKRGIGLSVTALAVHGVMTGVQDKVHRYRLNHFDIVTPDGQPVRWALNWLHNTGLRDRVYGPELTLRVCKAAADEGLPVYFYGSKPEVLERLRARMLERLPHLPIAGCEPSKFRRTTLEEKADITIRIRQSGAKIAFVGLGCPRQEVFAYEYRDALSIPVIAVGAAFDYHAGTLKEPPRWMQDIGLQWFYRLLQDPKRLWQRYLVLNTQFTIHLLGQLLRVTSPEPGDTQEPKADVLYG